jgi:hypothetical protein
MEEQADEQRKTRLKTAIKVMFILVLIVFIYGCLNTPQ